MASVNAKVRVSDYNVIQNEIATVMGTGFGQYGYGQVLNSSQVTTSDSVTVEQFANLRYDILNAYDHIFAAAPSGVTAPTESDRLRYNASNAPIDYWASVNATITANARNQVPSTRARTVNHGTQNITTTWYTGLVATVRVTFTTAEKARHFFASGSSIDFSSSRTGGSSTSQNSSWTTLLSTAGTQKFGGNFPGSGTSPQNGYNFFRLTNSFADPFANLVASSPYALNTWSIKARCLDVSNNQNGTSKDLEFEVRWTDGHFGLGGGPDSVDGTVTYAVQTTEATGTMQPASAGNFTIETPVIFVGGISVV